MPTARGCKPKFSLGVINIIFLALRCNVQPSELRLDAQIFFHLADDPKKIEVIQFVKDGEPLVKEELSLSLPAVIAEPENFEVLAVVPEGPTSLLILTRKHGLLETENLGQTWSRRDTGLPKEIVWPFVDHGLTKPIINFSLSYDKKRIALLFNEALYLSYDAGRTFKLASLKGAAEGVEYLAVAWHPNDANKILIGTAMVGRKKNGGLIYSLDGGKTASGFDKGLPGEPTYAPNYIEEIRSVCFGEGDRVYVGLAGGNGIYEASLSEKEFRPLAWLKGFYTYPDGSFYNIESLNYYEGKLYFTTDRGWRKIVNVTNPESGVLFNDSPLTEFFMATDKLLSFWDPMGFNLIPACSYQPKRTFDYDRRVEGKKGLYISYSFTQGENYPKLLRMLKELRLNAVVINMKNDEGDILVNTKDPLLKKTGAVSSYVNLKETFAKLKKDGIYIIGRVVCFKDSYLYKYNNYQYAIKMDNGIPLSKGPEKWVDPFCEEVWDYLIAAAKAIEESGVDEIQFDYVRFPDLKGDLIERAYYPYQKTGQLKREALVSFLKKARSKLTLPISIDLFGFQAVYKYGLWIGQDVTQMAAWVDAVSPMFYPSHYSGQFAYGYGEESSKKIYYTILISCKRAKQLVGQAYLRPYLQAFYYKDNTDNYCVDYIGWELDGLKNAGLSDYIFWNDLSEYIILLKGIRKYYDGLTGRLPEEILQTIPTKKKWTDFVEDGSRN